MFHGCIVPLVTPFTKENTIDEEAFSELVEWYVQEGADALVICGVTAEVPTLAFEEQAFLVKRAVEIVRKRIPVIAGTGTNDTRTTLELTGQAKRAGADGCLVVTPYLNRPVFEGCKLHFQETAKVGLPMIFYYHPGRTAMKLTPSMIAEIAKLPLISAIKEGSGDMEAMVELLQMTQKPALSGDDCFIIPMMAMGGAGCISIISNVIPREWKKMVAYMSLGDMKAARSIFNKYYRLAKSLVIETNPQGVKYALHLMGMCEAYMRLPMVEPRESTKQEIKEALQESGLLKNLAHV